MRPKPWESGNVRVIVTVADGKTEWAEVPGETHPSYPGLAVVPAEVYGDRRGFCIVHPPTGFLVIRDATSRTKARRVVEMISPLCDWPTGTVDELKPKANGTQLLATIKQAMGLLE